MKPDIQQKLIELAPVIGLTILAGAFRFAALGAAPPGLYHDEAFNGLDALGVLAGERPIYFPANHGREPMYIYLVALAVGLLGSSPLAVRLPAAIAGTLTIPATYWMVNQLWGRRAGLLAAAIMAVSLWPVHLSRIGFRAVLLPLFAAIGIGLAARAWRNGRRRDWIIAGAVWGLASYTYLAARFAPLVFLLVVTFLLIFRRIQAGPFLPQRLSNGAVWATVGFALAVAPLAIYTLGNWDVVMGRPGGVSVFEPGINRGDLPGTLVNNTLKALGMFVWQGDRIPRHNAPYRPVFDVLLAAAFVAGLVVMIRRARYRIAAVFMLTWLGVMLLPTILAEDTPHFLRAAGVLPVAAVFPALGLDWLAEKFSHGDTETQGNKLITSNSKFQTMRLRASVSLWLIIGVLGVSALWTLRDYAAYATSAETGYAFEAGAVELAGEINRLGASGYRVLMDDVFPHEWASIPFLLKRPPDVVLAPGSDLEAQPATPAMLVSWPYDEWLPRLDAWPAPAQVQVKAGPLVKGDRDPQPYPMAVLALVEPGATSPPASGGSRRGVAAEATFEGGIRLLGHAIEDRGDVWLLRTLWQIDEPATGDATQFVHLLDGGVLVTTVDGDAGDGLYPMRAWRAGDVVIDERRIQLPVSSRSQLSVAIGLYDRQNGARLKIVAANSPVVDGALQLGAPGGPGP
ncbi:MAG TPA: glycosyltransferase family 39 protein [Anaerolineae bacterium]|nr:glycosyltransferase family 39 protein [Anaerolineae bacterium]